MSDVMDTMSPMMGRVSAYFAPVNRTAQQATIFDAAQNGGFALDSPPAPWICLGWIAGFTRKCGTKIEPVRSGSPAIAHMQARTEIEATVSFAFESWGKLQLALSAGTQQMNLLKAASGSPGEGSGGAAVSAVALQSGSTANVIQVGAPAANGFTVGELIAVDVDYGTQTGFVGSGVSGAYVQGALTDVDYIRRVTLNVGRITAVNLATGALTLQWPLIAGVPTAAMKVSGVVGFCDREGSSFFQEWSAVFVGEGQQGERVIWHYPRLQAMSGAVEACTNVGGGYEKIQLSAAFRALPVKDPVDGETVVCFRSYVAG
ncbi:MAG TPA: hypothetical protein VK814_13860 [Acidobacteriaceae bacterium]|nr:hypothetical protein [Acidobacteriaceae bacterium]